jgi:hypothetical protein
MSASRTACGVPFPSSAFWHASSAARNLHQAAPRQPWNDAPVFADAMEFEGQGLVYLVDHGAKLYRSVLNAISVYIRLLCINIGTFSSQSLF